MYYITYYKQLTSGEITIEDVIRGVTPPEPKTTYEKITIKTDSYKPPTNLQSYRNRLHQLALQATEFELINGMEQYYHHFKIPKHSGGWRDINAPNDDLKAYQKEVCMYFQNTLKMLEHDAAYAYTKNRSSVDALKVHQATGANWFFKADVSNFFPSHNEDYIVAQLKRIYPMNYILESTQAEMDLRTILKACLLNDELPQGSPLSPALTNILMVPIDYELRKALINKDDNFYTYTRYADDIQITSPHNFNFNEITQLINSTFELFDAPFKLKPEKTRYGSKNGRNWNLGIMYNKNNELTLGHKRNQKLRAKIYQFFSDDLTEETKWSKMQVQQLMGEVAYAKMVEPDYINFVLNKYSTKFNKDFDTLTKNYLK